MFHNVTYKPALLIKVRMALIINIANRISYHLWQIPIMPLFLLIMSFWEEVTQSHLALFHS